MPMRKSDMETSDYSENSSESDQESDNDEYTESENNKRILKQTEKSNKKVKNETTAKDTKSAKKNNKKKETYKPPTLEELENLKQSENLYNNNLFRLQIEELIKEINIKNKRKKQLSTWLDNVKSTLDKVNDYGDINLSQFQNGNSVKLKKKQQKFINNIRTQYDVERYKTDQDVILKFIKPDCGIEIFGLYENNCLPGPNLEVNVNVKMPKSCLYTRDYLNNRYIIKRYFYLLYIAEYLSLQSGGDQIELIFHESNVLIPILEIKPKDTDKIIVKLYVSPSDEHFTPSRFLPNVNNVKIDLFDLRIDDDMLKDASTYFYNSTLGFDTTLSLNNAYLQDIFSEKLSLQEGVKLLTIWLRQRDLCKPLGGFTESLLQYFIAYLFSKRRISVLMNTYQVIRSFWSFVCSSDLENMHISLCEDVSPDVLDSFKCFDIVFLDRTGCYNLAAFLDIGMYRKVKLESAAALKHLDEGKLNSFHALFITKLPFHLQFDAVIDLPATCITNEAVNSLTTDVEKCKYIGYKHLITINKIRDTLAKGLNKRITNLVPYVDISNKPGTINGIVITKIMFGINLNPDEAFNFIENGPALNDYAEADKFRAFWGHLACDRRFRDGTTKVVVYFRTKTIRDKRNIIKKIVDFLLSEKLKILDKNCMFYYDQFDEFIVNKRIFTAKPYGTNEDACLRVIFASDELGKKIRAFQMSLTVIGIQGLSDIFSYTELFPPIAVNQFYESVKSKANNLIFETENESAIIPMYTPAIECLLVLEHSSRWPDHLEALHHLKMQFYIEIAKMLEKEHQILSHVTKDYFDVHFEGFVFRYKIYIPKEVGLTKKTDGEKGVVVYKETSESLRLEKQLNYLPKMISAMKGLQSQFPSFGPGTALIKRWLRSQLIDDYHFPDITISLLNASLYLESTAFHCSNTPQISFLRFLKFFTEFQWSLQPVVVNFNEEISREDLTEIESKFQENRSSFPQLYIITPFDNRNSVFSKTNPTKEVLCRVQQLAIVTLNIFNNMVNERSNFNIKDLFVPNFEGYNLLIHLKSQMNARNHEQIMRDDNEKKIILEKFVASENTKIPIVDFNPVQIYLNTLRKNYGEFATFFHDTYGGNTVAVLWHPKILEKKDFKVSHVHGRKLQDDLLVTNIDAIIDDFNMIGKGLVDYIEKK